ncbi:MAG: cell division protein FtsA, partial [Dehalococcoidia bacterium]
LADRAQEIFRIPSRVGVPKDMYGLADILFNPAYATSVGLLLWGARHGAENNWQQRRYWENFSGMARRLLFRMKRVFPR